MKIRNLFLILLMISAMVFAGCEKIEMQTEATAQEDAFNAENAKRIVTFKDAEEFENDMKAVLSYNVAELKKWEEKRGFISLGRMADELYFSIVPENFKSQDEVKQFVANHKDLLQLIPEENGEYTLEVVNYNDPKRYFYNKDSMYGIGTYVYKGLEEGTISAPKELTEKLANMTYADVVTLKSDSEIKFHPKITLEGLNEKDAAYNCGRHPQEVDNTKGNQRTVIDHDLYLDIIDGQLPILRFRCIVRPYTRVAFVWYWCSRTITADFNVAIDYNIGTGWNRLFYDFNQTKSDSKIEYGEIYPLSSYGASGSGFHFGGFDSYGDTPSTGPANLECNTTLF